MGVIIGSARCDERGKYIGGAAGDQTGKEVSEQPFYVSSKGWFVLRLKSDTHAAKNGAAMRRACNNNNIGYSQSDRYGIVKHGTATKVKCNADCGTLVRRCIMEATGKDVGDFTTASEASVLEKSGLFEKRVRYTDGMRLYTGDVLVTCAKGHTAIVTDGARRGSDSGNGLNKSERYKAKVTASSLTVRSWAGTENTSLRTLPKGTIVSVCDEVKASDGKVWYYIKESGRYGFASAKYLKKI